MKFFFLAIRHGTITSPALRIPIHTIDSAQRVYHGTGVLQQRFELYQGQHFVFDNYVRA